MFRLELKKLIKSKKILFILVFAMLLSIYSLLIYRNKMEVYENDFVNAPHLAIENFLNEPASETIQNELFTKLDIGPYPDHMDFRKGYDFELKSSKLFFEFLEDKRSEYPEIFSEKNQKRLDNLHWNIFKLEHIVKENAYDQYGYFSRDNFVSNLIKKSNLLFSTIPYLFFIVFFSDALSKEREDENLNLIYSQPKKRSSFVLSKFFSMIFSIIIYIIFILIFVLILTKIKGDPISGFKDPYRIMDGSNEGYYTGLKLLIHSLLVFFLITLFWSSLSMLLSSRFRSQTSLAVMLILYASLYALSPNLSFLNTLVNPIYAGQIIHRLLGGFSLLVNENGGSIGVFSKPYKTYFYLLYFLASILLLVLSMSAPYEIASFKARDKKTTRGLFNFEAAKILNQPSFYIYLFGGLVLFLSIFIGDYKINKSMVKETYGTEGMISKAYMSPISQLEWQIKNAEDLLSGNSQRQLVKVSTGEKISASELDEKNRSRIEGELERYKYELEIVKEKKKDVDKLYQYYMENASTNYYQTIKTYYSDHWDESTSSSLGDKVLSLNHSAGFNNKILKELADKNIDCFILDGVFYSPLDKYSSLDTNKSFTRNLPILGHSGPIYLYRLFIEKNLDLIILVLACLTAILGYSLDWDRGRQLELLYTSSYKKERIHTNKILSQFAYALLTFLLLIAFIFILGVIAGGLKGFNFPVAKYFGGQYEFIPLYSYLLKTLLATGAFILLLTCMINACSVYIKNRISLLSLGLGLTGLFSFLSNKLPSGLKALSPFSYIELDTLADQSIQVFKGLKNISYEYALGVILVWALIFYLLGLALIKLKKDL